MQIHLACAVLCLAITSCPGTVCAEEQSTGDVPNRYGMALVLGNTYESATDRGFVQISGFALFDYEKVWHHQAPDPLRFKVEFNVGTTTYPNVRFIGSAGFLALFYLDRFASERFRPYVEGGIEAIYTDFRDEGQGLRFNFNPQAGMGAEFTMGAGPPFFAAIRLHHISNAGIDDQNRGINSVLLMVGRFF